jgi:hypothetical protein
VHERSDVLIRRRMQVCVGRPCSCLGEARTVFVRPDRFTARRQDGQKLALPGSVAARGAERDACGWPSRTFSRVVSPGPPAQ